MFSLFYYCMPHSGRTLHLEVPSWSDAAEERILTEERILAEWRSASEDRAFWSDAAKCLRRALEAAEARADAP